MPEYRIKALELERARTADVSIRYGSHRACVTLLINDVAVLCLGAQGAMHRYWLTASDVESLREVGIEIGDTGLIEIDSARSK